MLSLLGQPLWSALLSLVVRAYFVSAIAAVLSTQLWSRQLQPMLVYGKTSELVKGGEPSHWLVSRMSSWHVPRAWFRHFYILSTFLGLFLLSATEHLPLGSASNILLLLTHSVRRLYECLYVERPSGSKMWIGHYIVGLSFYTFVNLAMISDDRHRAGIGGRASLQALSIGVWHFLCVSGFFVAQAYQHLVHRQLASIRASCGPAPHYTAEVLLYLCLALLNGDCLNMWLVSLWTASILGTSALQTDSWGRSKFADWGNRWIILPGII